MDTFSSLYNKIKELTLNLKEFNRSITQIIEDRTIKLTRKINSEMDETYSNLNNSYQLKVYNNIRNKLVENKDSSNFFEKKLLDLYKEIKKLSNYLNIFENSFINLIINNFSSKDLFHLKVNLLMKKFNNQIDDSLL